MGEFEKHWWVLLRGRQAATALTFATMILAAAYTLGVLALLVDRHGWPFLPADGLFGLRPSFLALLGGLAISLLFAAFTLFFEPGRLDRALDVREAAEPGDPGSGGAVLNLAQAAQVNRALDELRAAVAGWRAREEISGRPTLYWSPVLERNAVTYGDRSDRVRVVFAADLMLDGGDPGPEGEGDGLFSGGIAAGDRLGILAHELGHAESRDGRAGAVIGGIMRVLTFLYLPLLILDRLLALVAWLLSFLPLVGFLLSFLFQLATRGMLLLALLLYRCCQVVDRAQGHLREYVADAFAARLLGSADEVLSGLMALSGVQLSAPAADAASSPLGRVVRREGRQLLRPTRWDRYATLARAEKEAAPESTLGAVGAFLGGLGSTHPPVPARLSRLAKLGFALELDRREEAR